jgi:hypothetical protein
VSVSLRKKMCICTCVQFEMVCEMELLHSTAPKFVDKIADLLYCF